MPQGPIRPPSRKLASGEIPGAETLRPGQNDQLISLTRQLGQSFATMGEQMMKAPDMDTFAMTRAAAIMRQSQAAMQRLGGGSQQPQGVDMASSEGRPNKPDGRTDPMTRRSTSGQLSPGGPQRL